MRLSICLQDASKISSQYGLQAQSMFSRSFDLLPPITYHLLSMIPSLRAKIARIQESQRAAHLGMKTEVLKR